jgi:hypothetical protein
MRRLPVPAGTLPSRNSSAQDHVLLGPQRDHRLVAGAAVVGRKRALLLALEDRRIDVDRRHRLRPPLLEKADQPATGPR